MKNPLNKDSKEKLSAIGRELRNLVGVIQKCKRCNQDMETQERAAIYLYDVISSIEREFGNGQALPDLYSAVNSVGISDSGF